MKKRFLLRIIISAFPKFNIYTFAAKTTTSIGPLYVATSANKLENWDVEVIDENNCHGKYCPKDENSLPDHIILQQERKADIVGFYGSISSSIPRLYELAKLYKQMGVITIAGGKHIENMVEEAFNNNIDFVFFKEAEITIKEFLLAYENKKDYSSVKGIAYKKDNKIIKTEERELIEDLDSLPFPDYNLLRFAKMKFYPIIRTRGCNSKCEFCAVKEKARYHSAEYTMALIKHLVETRNASHFFEVSDHFASNKDEAIRFCKMLASYQKKIGKKFIITVQTRITDARHEDLLQAMKEAYIDTVCIGYESPIDEELIAMRKGYLSKDLINWTNIYHKYNFFIHGMFIFGYPKKSNDKTSISLQERVKRFKSFIKKAKIDTVQILITIPLPGTELRERLEKENRIFDLKEIGWEYYDGQFPLYKPDDNITPEELQKAVGKMMSNFYNFRNFLRIVTNIIFNFPALVFTSTITLITFRVKYIVNAFKIWYRKFFRNYALRFGGHLVVRQWYKNFKKDKFVEKLKKISGQS